MYLVAIVLANLTVTWWGPNMSVVNALLFIGLDLTSRDHLHEAWRNSNLFLKMLALISAGSALSYLLNRNAGPVAVASFVAFAAAGATDALVYHHVRKKLKRFKSINLSNVASAAVDSVVFPLLAFGWPPLAGIMALQFLAKTLGGLGWALILRRK